MSSEKNFTRYRPLTVDKLETACRMAARGMKLGAIMVELGYVDPYEWWQAMQLAGEAANAAFGRARVAGLERRVDEILMDDHTDATTSEAIARAKLLADNVRWLAGKRISNIYGDKLEVTAVRAPDIRAKLDGMDARRRQLEQGDSADEAAALLAKLLDES